MIWSDRKSIWNDGPGFESLLDDPCAPHPVANRHICNDGGGKSGSQSVFSNSNSTATAGPNPFISGKLEHLIGGEGGTWDWIGKNWWAPDYFPQGTVAPESGASRLAINNLLARGMDTGQSGLGTAAKGMTLDTLSGKYLDPASNPAYQGWLEASFRPQAEQFRDILAPAIDAKFAGSGRTSSGAHFNTTMRGVQDLERAQADAAAKAGLGMYQGERNNQFAAAGLLPQFQALDYQNLEAIARAGAMDDQRGQRVLDDKNAKYSYDATSQLDWYNRLAQTLQGMYPGGQTTGQQSSSSYGFGGGGGGGGVGSFVGPALQVAGMALPFLSDRRDKTDIEVLGIDPLTGLKTYAYRYKGEPKNRPKIVGPMAQDIEEVRPDLVREIGGHKVVGMPQGGLL